MVSRCRILTLLGLALVIPTCASPQDQMSASAAVPADSVSNRRAIYIVGYANMQASERKIATCLMDKLKKLGPFSFVTEPGEADWSLALRFDIPSFWVRTQDKQPAEVFATLMSIDGTQVSQQSNQYWKSTSIWGGNVECGLANGLAKKIAEAIAERPKPAAALPRDSVGKEGTEPSQTTAASAEPTSTPQKIAFDRTVRIEIPGVSVLPPQADGWLLWPASDEEAGTVVRFVQREHGPTRPDDLPTVRASVYPTYVQMPRPPATTGEYLAYTVEDARKRIGKMITKHQRLVAFDGALDGSKSATCVKFHQLTETKDAFPGLPSVVMMISTVGLVCSHPQWPIFDINVRYEQLYVKGQSPENRDAEADAFLAGIVLTPNHPVVILEGKPGLDAP
jgi:hypothetical protein